MLKQHDNDWRENLLTHPAQIEALLAQAKTVAVLGIKTEMQAGQPAFYVPQYLAAAGLNIIPVPVYYPEVTEILGRAVYRRLIDIPCDVDIVNVFRRSTDIPPHVDDILAKRPKAVWFQLGIRNDEAAEVLARAGIQVVQNRCLMVDYRAIRQGL
jgi:predicted CoA-binding protein